MIVCVRHCHCYGKEFKGLRGVWLAVRKSIRFLENLFRFNFRAKRTIPLWEGENLNYGIKV
jgi:hypothetical protein